MKIGRVFFVLLILAFIGIQFVEVERTNPPVNADINAPTEVKNIFKSSCYDCHSNETAWPWYSKIAPISWLIVDDVMDGRKKLNFSEWEKFYSDKRTKLKKKILDEINQDEMPKDIYTIMHTNAKLDIIQKNIIKKWVTE
ncbi:MAG: heme-binding domain-containing protein [Ignavibacteriales bacterium]|nr:heme-binding domain-containing protein [Ignavibacteriales bacterium]